MKVQNVLKIAVLSLGLATIAGCSTTLGQTFVSQKQQGVQYAADGNEPASLRALKCPKAIMTVSLSPLKCKAASCKSKNEGTGNMASLVAFARQQEGIPDLSGFGDGMTDMLTTSLASTGCFELLDRELLEELAREQRLAGKEVALKGADALATGAISSLSYDKSKSSFGGGLIPVIGGVSSSKVTAKIGMDVRVVDVNTGSVAYTQSYDAQSGKRSYGMSGGGMIGSGLFGGSHSVQGGVEIEEAAREIIMNVTNDMVEKLVPKSQYQVQYVDVASKD